MGVSLNPMQVAPSGLSPGWRFQVDEFLFLSASASEILQADSDRTSIVLIDAPSSDVVFVPVKGRVNSLGVRFAQGQTPLPIVFSDWGPIVGEKWIGYAETVNTSVLIAVISWDGVNRGFAS